jgi:hypothetical protein
VRFDDLKPGDVTIAHDGMRNARCMIIRIDDLTTEHAQALVRWLDGVRLHKGEETITLSGQVKRLENIDFAEFYGLYAYRIENSRKAMHRKGLPRAHAYHGRVVSPISDAVSIDEVWIDDAAASAIQQALQADGMTMDDLSMEAVVLVSLRQRAKGVEVARVVSDNELIDRADGHVSRRHGKKHAA